MTPFAVGILNPRMKLTFWLFYSISLLLPMNSMTIHKLNIVNRDINLTKEKKEMKSFRKLASCCDRLRSLSHINFIIMLANHPHEQ